MVEPKIGIVGYYTDYNDGSEMKAKSSIDLWWSSFFMGIFIFLTSMLIHMNVILSGVVEKEDQKFPTIRTMNKNSGKMVENV